MTPNLDDKAIDYWEKLKDSRRPYEPDQSFLSEGMEKLNWKPLEGNEEEYGNIFNTGMDAIKRFGDSDAVGGSLSTLNALGQTFKMNRLSTLMGPKFAKVFDKGIMPGISTATGAWDLGKLAMNSIKTGNVDPVGGAMQGAMAGKALGPVGMGVGAAVGAIAGSIGTPGMVDYEGNVKYANGLNGLFGFGHSKGYLNMLARRAKSNQANMAASERLREENPYEDATLMADGGFVPNSLAYLDDGELIRTPQGDIMQVPEEHKAEDTNLVNVPEGTQVLSDKRKVPGTNKTFAQVGRLIMKLRKYRNDIYGLNSKMLNDYNNQVAFDNLLAMLEETKVKSRGGIPRYEDGTKGTHNVRGTVDYTRDMLLSDAYKKSLDRINLENYTTYNDLQNRFPGLNATSDPTVILQPNEAVGAYGRDINKYTNLNDLIANLISAGTIQTLGNTGDNAKGGWADNYAGSQYSLRHFGRNTDVDDSQLDLINSLMAANNSGLEAFRNPATGMINWRPIGKPTTNPEDVIKGMDWSTPDLNIPKGSMKFYRKANVTGGGTKAPEEKKQAGIPDISPYLLMLGNLGYAVNPDPVHVYTYEPTYGPTTYDISPVINDINTSSAMSRYNAARLNPITGYGMAQNIAAAMVRNKALNDAYSRKYNVETDLAHRNANIANERNRYDAEARHRQAEEYAKNKAAADTYNMLNNQARVSNYASAIRDLKSERNDKAVMQYAMPFLSYGQNSQVLNSLLDRLFG